MISIVKKVVCIVSVILMLTLFCFSSFGAPVIDGRVIVPYASGAVVSVIFSDETILNFMLPSVYYTSDTGSGITYDTVSSNGYSFRYAVYALYDSYVKAPVFDLYIYDGSPTYIVGVTITCNGYQYSPSLKRPVFSYYPLASTTGTTQSYQGSFRCKTTYVASKYSFTCYTDPSYSVIADAIPNGIISQTATSHLVNEKKARTVKAWSVVDAISLVVPSDSYMTDSPSFLQSNITYIDYDDHNYTLRLPSKVTTLPSYSGTVRFDMDDVSTVDIRAGNVNPGFALRFDGYYASDGPGTINFLTINPYEKITAPSGFFSGLINDINALFGIRLFEFGGIEFTLGYCFLTVLIFGILFFVIRLFKF